MYIIIYMSRFLQYERWLYGDLHFGTGTFHVSRDSTVLCIVWNVPGLVGKRLMCIRAFLENHLSSLPSPLPGCLYLG